MPLYKRGLRAGISQLDSELRLLKTSLSHNLNQYQWVSSDKDISNKSANFFNLGGRHTFIHCSVFIRAPRRQIKNFRPLLETSPRNLNSISNTPQQPFARYL